MTLEASTVPKANSEALNPPRVETIDYSTQPLSGVYIMSWVLVVGCTIALGFFFWWLCHSKQDRENRINPNSGVDGGAYTNASMTERNET